MRALLTTVLMFALTGPAFASSALEGQVLKALNQLRTNPRSYLPHLKQLRKKFEGNYLRLSPHMKLKTFEGPSAVDEAIDFVKSASAVGPVMFSAPLSHAARDLQRDQAKTGQTGHDGSDGSSPDSRMSRYTAPATKRGEDIAYGGHGGYAGPTGIDMVTGLLVDDGVSDRGHRANLMDPEFKVIGVSCGSHPKYEKMCVIDFASSVQAIH